MVIVIDALDECEKNEDIRTILKLVPQVQDSASIRLKVFLTSRPELHIRQEFQLNHQHEDLVLDKRPKEEIEHDIQLWNRCEEKVDWDVCSSVYFRCNSVSLCWRWDTEPRRPP